MLTKRPENIEGMLPIPWQRNPWPNVWLGTSVENQEAADKRIPELLKVPAAVRFLSCEPLLGPLDLRRWVDEDETGFVQEIQWVIIGGESGAKARPFDVAWARSLILQCRDGGRAEPAVFVKQLGAWPEDNGTAIDLADRKGGDMAAWTPDLRVREFPEAR